MKSERISPSQVRHLIHNPDHVIADLVRHSCPFPPTREHHEHLHLFKQIKYLLWNLFLPWYRCYMSSILFTVRRKILQLYQL